MTMMTRVLGWPLLKVSGIDDPQPMMTYQEHE